MGVALKVSSFGGMMPAVDDRLLPQDNASLSQNAYLYSGKLQGIYTPSLIHTLANPSATKVFRIPNSFTDNQHLANSTWLEFVNQDTDVLRGPVVGDTFQRYYWASSNAQPQYNTLARIQASSNAFLLGVPQPAVAPGVSVSGGSGLVEARSYVYTYVTAYGEEGPPSSPTVVTGFISGTWNLTFTPPVANDTNLVNRNVTSINIYRTATGSDGTTTYFFVATVPCGIIETGNEHSNTTIDGLADTTRILSGYNVTGSNIPANTTVNGAPGASSLTLSAAATATTSATLTFSAVYADSVSDATVVGNNQLQSTTWTAPPTDLQGWVAMPNGMIAGWRQNEVWFCEPFRPHAWPSAYAVALDYSVIGLGVIGQTLVICTAGSPYWAYGVNPSTVSMSKLQAIEPCTARGSIVSTPEGVYYASPNGLMLVAYGQVVNATRKLLTKDKWANLVPINTLRASRLGAAYYGWGAARTGVFDANSYDNASFDQTDLSGARQGLLMDLLDPRVALTTLTNTNPSYNTFNDPWTGEVFIIRNGGVYWLNISNADPTHEAYVWQSKVFQTPNKRNLEAMKCYFEVPDTLPPLNATPNTSLIQTLAPGQYGLIRLYADGNLVWTRELRTSGELMRFPSGYKADFWQIQINAYVNVFNVQAAESAKELQKV